MNPGKFDRKIQVKRPTQGKTPQGAKSITYTLFDTVWAERRAESVREAVMGSRLTVSGRYRYLTHNLAYIDESYRITDDGSDFNIVSVDPVPGGVFMYVTAERIQS